MDDIIVFIKHNKLTRQDIYLMTYYPEFRSVFYYRIGLISRLIEWLCPSMPNLFLRGTKIIGGGLFIEHGFSPIVVAKSIGKICFINQQVTIGYSHGKNPIIGDNVKISAGAKIVGGIIVGNNVVIGTNAVVIRDVPDNCTVVGIPAYIVRRNGIRVKEIL